DQRAFKQTRVVACDRKLAWSIPVANVVRRITRGPRYPLPGEYVSFFYVSFIAIDNDDVNVFRALLRRVYNDAVGSADLYAMLSLHERDPFLPALRDYSLTPFDGRLFCACYEDGEEDFGSLDARIPQVEAATF